MRKFPAERNIAAVLFVLVFVTFSLAERDSKKLKKLYAPTAKVYHQLTLAFQFKKNRCAKE
jgi:hypothetical protein